MDCIALEKLWTFFILSTISTFYYRKVTWFWVWFWVVCTHYWWNNGLRAIVYRSWSSFLFARGSMTLACYVDDVLGTTLLSYLGDRPRVTFQQDNPRSHITLRTMDFLLETGMNVLPLPPHSAISIPSNTCGIW